MGNEFKNHPGHSAENFSDTRDHWWNLDFLELIAKRWRLDAVRDVLDVGCGVGHWGRALAQVLPGSARLTGIDREPAWVEAAAARARARGLERRFSYRQGEAQHLLFADDTFDLVTCQTVLIHVPDPARVLDEMQRVTKPGGLVAVAEPNNLAESLLLDSISNQGSVEEILDAVRLQLLCERGKVVLGEGDNSLGNRLAGLFVAQGLTDVQVFVNDKASAIFPPYESSEQRAFVEDARERAARRLWNWSEADTRRFFLAGGGSEQDFASSFELGLAARAKLVRGMDEGTYQGVLGGSFYLVAGRKNAR